MYISGSKQERVAITLWKSAGELASSPRGRSEESAIHESEEESEERRGERADHLPEKEGRTRGWIRKRPFTTPLPHSPPFVCGAINLRGTVLPIIDFAMRMGLPPTAPDASYVTIILEVGTQVFGIVVDAVSDIVTLDFNTLQRPPELESNVDESCLHGIIARDDSMMRVINTNALFPRQVARAA